MLCQTSSDNPPSYKKFEGGDSQFVKQQDNLYNEHELDLIRQLSEGDQDFIDYLIILEEARGLYKDRKNLTEEKKFEGTPDRDLTTQINELVKTIESLKQNVQACQKYQKSFKKDKEIPKQEETPQDLEDSDKKEEEQAQNSKTLAEEQKEGQEKKHIRTWAEASFKTKKTIDKIEKQEVQVHEIIWEPSKLIEKIATFLHGSAEAIFICLLGVWCLEIPSAVSVSFFIIANLFQFTMVFDITYRYLYGLIVLAINLLCVVGIVIAKIIYLKKQKNLDLNSFTVQDDFDSKVNLYQSLGFQLNCTQKKEIYCEKIKLYGNITENNELKINTTLSYTMEINGLGSFSLEILYLFMIFVFGTYMVVQFLKIKKLLKTSWSEIYEYRLLEKETNQKKDDDEDGETENKTGLGTSMKINVKSQKEEQEYLKQAKEKYKEMSKRIPKNFVQSSFYYNLNTRFFMCSFFFTVVAALTAKSMLDVPSFILILGMCGGYMVRKKISFFYTTYCFFLMYYISFIMFIKICHDCVISIPYVQSKLSDEGFQKDFNLIIFGSLMFREENTEPNPDLQTSKSIYLLSLFLCFFFTQCWKNAKWMEIREKTEEKKVNFVSRFIQYINVRVAEDLQIKKVRDQKSKGDESAAEDVLEEKQGLKEIRPKRKLYDEISKKLKKTQDKSTLTKLYILWTARFLMTMLAYMYHSTAGLINLLWVITSFLFPDEYVYLFSILCMIPVILLEFILIYSNKVAVIKNKEFFKNYGGYFQWKMISETYECILFFLVLALFFFMIGIYFDTVDKKQENSMNEILQFLKIRIQNKNYSSFWKYLFVFFGQIHIILLFLLFLKSLQNFNNFKNMGSLILVILFISSNKFYRKAGFLLMWFFALFIVAQYYFSLCWQHFLTPKHQVAQLYWFTFFPGKLPEQTELYTQNPFSEQLRSSLYFGFTPNSFDWFILFIVNLVGTINDTFKDEKTVKQLNDEIQETFEAQHSTLIYYKRRITNIFNIIFLFVINISMILVQLRLAETNVIMWIFFLLSIYGLMQIIRANRSEKEIKRSINISKFIKLYSCFVLVLNILFLAIFGEFRKDNDEAYDKSFDYKLSKAYPIFYKLIPYIGLRSIKYKDIRFSQPESEKVQAQFQLSCNIFFQVFILLVSSYLEQYFRDQIQLVQKENQFFDEDYKKMFEYGDQSTGEKQNTTKEDKEKNSQKKSYSQKDFIDHYEEQRFTKPFFAYRQLHNWDKIDTVCTYGHLVNNFLIFYIALFRNFSIYLFVNLTFILCFYVLASLRTSRRSKLNQKVSGLQSQCDVAMGKLITKKHKTEAFREFLKLRIKVWYLQFFAFLVALLIGYPTSIFSSLRSDAYKEAIGKDSSEKGLAPYKNLLDKAIFWLFFTGVFKDEASKDFVQKNQFYLDFLMILFGLFIERNMINWLKDRFGCTYYKFQKFIELDMRREAIRQGWKNQTPDYNIERYRQHYFLNGFDELEKKFYHINYEAMIKEKNEKLDYENKIIQNENVQLVAAALAKSFTRNFSRQKTTDFEKLDKNTINKVFTLPKTNLELKYEKDNYGDFIPAKEAFRINDMIRHCLELECQATYINLDEQSQELLCERIAPKKKAIKNFFEDKLAYLDKIQVDKQQNLNYKLYIDQIKDLILRISQSPSVVVTEENKIEIDPIPSQKLKNFTDSLGNPSKEIELKDIINEEISTLKRISESQSVDYEGVPILRKYKTDQLRKILRDNIDFKYAVSFAKGNQIIIEGIILFMIMLSLCLKCNIFSLVYILFLIRYPQVDSKSGFMVRLSFYMAVIIFINYSLLLFNMTQKISPRKFPEPFENYPNWDEAVNQFTKPQNQTQFYWEKEEDRLNNGANWNLVYPIPFAFQIKVFRQDLLFCYLIGVGIDSQQVYSIFIDLITIYIVAMYTVTFRNPILQTKMKKVFWQFPQKNESGYEDRLEPVTRKLVNFIQKPEALYNSNNLQKGDKKEILNSKDEIIQRNQKYDKILLPKGFTQDLSVQQFNFIGEYRKSIKIQLNNTLINYVDITYDLIWSEEFVKEKKREIKNNSIFFRLVKRGSVLIYLTFHIITILIILLMSVTRESLLSLGYILILLPSIKDGAEVLKQRELKIELAVKKKKEEMMKASWQFPDHCRAQIEGYLETQIPKKNKEKMQKDIVEYFLKKDSQISIQLNEALKKLDQKLIDEAKLLLDNRKYDDLLEILKNYKQIDVKGDVKEDGKKNDKEDGKKNDKKDGKKNDKEDGERQFQENRYEAMLLLCVHRENNKLKKGSQEDENFKADKERIIKLDKEIKDLNRQLQARKLKEFQRGQNKHQKSLEWKFIGTLKNALLVYALLDFLLSILYQLPTPYTSVKTYGMVSLEKIIGLTKIFVFPENTSQGEFKARNLFSADKGNLSLDLVVDNLITQAFNCFIIAFIIIQGQIFESTGYQKYISQDNGSMDLLVQLSELKAKSMTYVFNNMKIRKITSVQKHKEKLVAIVENIKLKLSKWRKSNKNLIKLEESETDKKTEENEKLLQVKKALITIQTDAQMAKEAEMIELIKKALEGLVKKHEKQKKTVKFDEEVIAKEEKKQLEDEDDEVYAREHKIPPEEINEKTEQLIEQLFAQKIKKRGTCVRFYLWLHESFTEQILFKNEKSELEQIVQSHASGEIKTPTEFEKLMRTELKELVKIHLDSKENQIKFQIAIHKLKKNPEKYTLMELTEMDKQIRFSDMKMSFEFTRSFAMFINYIETFFCILVSQSEAFIYIGMIFSMYMNAGVISLFYPFMAFGYGMLEEKRTGKVFFRWIRWYTTGLLLFKFVVTLRIAKEGFFDGETWRSIQATTLFGVLSAEDGITSTFYMLPEIIIICFIMLNEIKLKLLGLYENRELDIEMITDGIIRIRCKGDEQQMKQRLALQSHSNMEPLMTSCKEKKRIDQEYYASKKRQIQMDLTKKKEINNQYLLEEYNNNNLDLCVALELQKQNTDKNYDCLDLEGFNNLQNKYGKEENNKQFLEKFTQNNLKDEQLKAFKDVSLMMWNTALDFDLDSTGKKSLSDELIKKQAIQKTLENDFICFVEGFRRPTQLPFLSEQQFTNFKYEKENWENMSCADHEYEIEEKFNQIAERKKAKKGFFDSNPYYDTLFPSLKIQKPGGDWYGCTTLTLSFIAIYIFMFFEKYTFDYNRFPFYKKESALLTGESSITVIVIIFIIIFERIANRTDTKSSNPEKLDLGKKGEMQKKNFSQDDFIVRSTTVRSMTVKLQKTQKTIDLDLNDQGTQNYLENLDMNEEEIDRARTRITKQQKYKYFIHLFMLIVGHLYIFWYIPLKFNYKLHGSFQCNKDNDYGCMNFHTNGYLRGLYVLLIIYLIFSSIQLSQGMPLKRKASSVLQYYNDLGKIGSDIFATIPFAIEIRVAVDYCFSKTSLDFFQTLQLYYYHYTFYASMIGNRYYLQKKVGEKQTFADKWLCGYLTGIIFVGLWMGVLYLFSTYSFFTVLNPIDTALLRFNFVVSNTIVINDNDRIVIKRENEKKYPKQLQVTSNITYNLYVNQNPNVKTLTENEFSDRYTNSTMIGHSAQSEHLSFINKQVQDVLVPTYSEQKWDLSQKGQDYLFNDLADAIEILDRPDLYNFTLQYDFTFGRAGPVGFEKTNAKINRTLNATNYFDCLTAQELKKISSLECNSKNKNAIYASAIFSQAFIPQIVLGQTREGSELVLDKFKEEDQKLDVQLTYFCNQTWKIEGKNGTTDKSLLIKKLKNLTIIENSDDLSSFDQYLKVDDVKTCHLAHQKFQGDEIERQFTQEINDYRQKGYEKNILKFKDSQGKEQVKEFILNLSWGKLKFVIFSMYIVTGFIAGSSPTGFISGTVMILYALIKPALILIWGDANIWEGTHHMPLIKLCEAVYMYRHEEDLVNEELTYRLIQEIVRSTEFLKAITGSTLRGDMDPSLDKLDETQKERLKHLLKLEAQGFDVEDLKKKIIKPDKNQSGENLFNQEDDLMK